jgi:NADPH2 dehydrogenase
MYENLLSPTIINRRTIKNKVVAAPPPTFLCEKDGSLTPQFFSYYKNLANTEPGILIIESSAINKDGRAWPNQCVISDEMNFLAISELVIKIRNQETLPMIQLYHGGINALAGKGNKVYGPSSISNKNIKNKITALTTGEIDFLVEEYKKATSLIWNVGFSGVEINAAEGTIIHQFLSPITNQRKDEYAYGYDNGILFLRKIISAIKSIGPDLVLSLKLSLRDLIPGGAGLKSAIEIANDIKEAGVDLFHVTEGLVLGKPSCLHPFLRGLTSPAPFADDSLIFKNETKTNIILSGGMFNPVIAEKVLSKDCCSFVALGRELNREPEWISMAMTNQPIEFYKKCKECMLCKAPSEGCIEEKNEIKFVKK